MLLIENPGESPEFLLTSGLLGIESQPCPAWLLWQLSLMCSCCSHGRQQNSCSLKFQGWSYCLCSGWWVPFRLLLEGECTAQIQAGKAKARSCLIFTAIKVHKERMVVILFHLTHRDTVHRTWEERVLCQCWITVNNTKIVMLCVTEHTDNLFYGRLETKHLLYQFPSL